jgi:hypothetical protein
MRAIRRGSLRPLNAAPPDRAPGGEDMSRGVLDAAWPRSGEMACAVVPPLVCGRLECYPLGGTKRASLPHPRCPGLAVSKRPAWHRCLPRLGLRSKALFTEANGSLSVFARCNGTNR